MRALHTVGRRWAVAAGLSVVGLVAGASTAIGATAGSTQTADTSATRGAYMSRSMMLTVGQVAKADPRQGWSVQRDRGILPRTWCGPASQEGKRVAQRLARGYTDDMSKYGAQYLTRYNTKADARKAYASIVAVVRTCKAAKPKSPTHGRKLTVSKVKVGDATTILRWYDYPLPNDPGSEAGTFPYAVTLKGTTVSVLAFWGYGHGVKPANFQKMAVAAGAKLPR
ncbi:hypothetical protein [Kribbella sp. CA-294648]|uniref:hypothetical protein n=1 Tax=Kribbella sp. CA-294648 TaxID=3239948 RepID=UPI003D9167FE